MVEYSGKYLGILMLMHEFATFVEVSLFVNLFLGGASTIWVFLVKYFFVYISAVIVSALMPRFRVEDGVKFYWKWPLILAFVQGLITLGLRFLR